MGADVCEVERGRHRDMEAEMRTVGHRRGSHTETQREREKEGKGGKERRMETLSIKYIHFPNHNYWLYGPSHDP